MKQYHDLLKLIIQKASYRTDRTNTGTLAIFGHQMRFDLSEGFPLVTTKKVFTKGIIHELLWFIKGDTNIQYLLDNGVHIWDDWALEEDHTGIVLKENSEIDERELNSNDPTTITNVEIIAKKGDLGPVYGKQWRSWVDQNGKVIDQLKEAIETIKTRPNSRRIIVNSWNVGDLPIESISPRENVKLGRMALAPCHCMFQFDVEPVSYEWFTSELTKLGHGEEVEKLDELVEKNIGAFELEKLINKLGTELKIPTGKLSMMLIQR